MKCTRQVRHHVHSVALFVEVHDVKRHAIVDLLCRPVVNVVIGVQCRAFRFACCCTLCRPNSHTVVVHPTLFPLSFFTCFHCILTAF